MQKFFTSSVVITAFVAYSLYQRSAGAQITPVIAPKSISSLPSGYPQSIPTNTPVPTSPPAPTQSVPPQITTSPSATPVPQNTQAPTPTPTPSSQYKNGSFTGDAADAFYGMIQVQATISNGKLTNVQFLQAPNDRGTSIYINSQADPMLAQEAIQAQSANVNIVSGATDSSQAFIQSLQSALSKAKA